VNVFNGCESTNAGESTLFSSFERTVRHIANFIFALQKEASGARNYDKIAISSLSFEENQSGPVNTYGICMGTDLLDVAERLPGHRKRDRAAFSRVVYGFATRDAKWTPNRISRQEFS